MIKWEKLGLSRGPFTHPPFQRVHVYLDDASQTPAGVLPYDAWPYHAKLSLDLEEDGRLHGLIWIGLQVDDYGTKLVNDLLDIDIMTLRTRPGKWRYKSDWEHIDIWLGSRSFDDAMEAAEANQARDARNFRIQNLARLMTDMSMAEIQGAITIAGLR